MTEHKLLLVLYGADNAKIKRSAFLCTKVNDHERPSLPSIVDTSNKTGSIDLKNFLKIYFRLNDVDWLLDMSPSVHYEIEESSDKFFIGYVVYVNISKWNIMALPIPTDNHFYWITSDDVAEKLTSVYLSNEFEIDLKFNLTFETEEDSYLIKYFYTNDVVIQIDKERKLERDRKLKEERKREEEEHKRRLREEARLRGACLGYLPVQNQDQEIYRSLKGIGRWQPFSEISIYPDDLIDYLDKLYDEVYPESYLGTPYNDFY